STRTTWTGCERRWLPKERPPKMAKWIIAVKLPSGSRYALSVYEKTFALVQMSEHGTVKGALVWNSKAEAEAHLEKQLEAAPDLERMGDFEFHEMTEPS